MKHQKLCLFAAALALGCAEVSGELQCGVEPLVSFSGNELEVVAAEPLVGVDVLLLATADLDSDPIAPADITHRTVATGWWYTFTPREPTARLTIVRLAPPGEVIVRTDCGEFQRSGAELAR